MLGLSPGRGDPYTRTGGQLFSWPDRRVHQGAMVLVARIWVSEALVGQQALCLY